MKTGIAAADEWIARLSLKPHPEGGYFAEIFRSEVELQSDNEKRNLATSIYFLLVGKQKSHWHQLASDEIWYFHAGSEVNLHMYVEGEYEQHLLGLSPLASPQIVIPAGSVFGAQCKDDSSYCLMSCVVAPGFDFKDFRIVPANELLEIFPEDEVLIKEFALK